MPDGPTGALHGHRPQAGCHPFRTFELAGNVATLLAAKWLELSEGFLMMDHPLEGFGRAAAAVPSPLSANVSSATACWRANSLRRSSSAVSIFWPIHSSIDGLIISRTRPSIVISATAIVRRASDTYEEQACVTHACCRA